MHDIEPYYNWLKYYNSYNDENSPFYKKETNYQQYTDQIYNFYIDPAWDYIGSETLYAKVLFADYDTGYLITELIGEWNDAITNDIMFLKQHLFDYYLEYGINKLILVGENVMNFHGLDDTYYEELFEELDDGWVVALNFRPFVLDEWRHYHLDYYINFGGDLQIDNWRTFKPAKLCEKIHNIISRRIELK